MFATVHTTLQSPEKAVSHFPARFPPYAEGSGYTCMSIIDANILSVVLTYLGFSGYASLWV
ncbi:hypothetical protein CPB84DRAFT_1795418, partial [Gymnopilus junonius]